MNKHVMAAVLTITMLAGAGAAHAQKMYRWVDEKGKTHYGDSIPPQYSDQGSAQLSKQGTVVKTTDRALTAEERKAKEAEEAAKKEADRKETEQKRKDKALLDTYTSEKDIDLALNRNMQQIEGNINNIKLQLKNLQLKIDDARKRADAFKNPKAMPEQLKDEIVKNEKEKARLEGLIFQFQQEMNSIKANFAADKKRFQELKADQEKMKTQAGK